MAPKFPNLSSKILLAPMHDITNTAFRLMCKKYGAGLVSTELLSANAVARENKAVLELARFSKEESPIAAQIFSSNTENIVKAAKILEKEGFDLIDLNLGCPSDRIINQGCGGALLKRKNKVGEIVKALTKAVSIPVTVKIRSGFDKKNVNAVEIAKICEENGASAIILHPRTVDQGYSGKADWNLIKKLKDNSKIPIIGNGDVICGYDAENMLYQTNCDYIMIGRSAIGNPFIFKEINEYLKTGKVIKQTKEEKIRDFFEYIELAKKFDIFLIKDAKQKAMEFTRGLPGSSKLRHKLNTIKDWETIEKMVRDMGKRN